MQDLHDFFQENGVNYVKKNSDKMICVQFLFMFY